MKISIDLRNMIMQQQNNIQVSETKTEKKPYQKPAFIYKRAFERQALSCSGCLNQSSSFPAFCAMRS